MILSKKSWHYRFYKFLYGNDDPENFCPYFWAIVFSCLFIVPVLLCSLPIFAWSVIKENELSRNRRYEGIFPKYVFAGLLSWMGLGVVTCMVLIWFPHMFANEGIRTFGILGYVFLAIGLILLAVIFYADWRENQDGTIIGTAWDSWYNRNCPQIKWKQNEKLHRGGSTTETEA